jgi:hypothetical protein
MLALTIFIAAKELDSRGKDCINVLLQRSPYGKID